MPKSRQDSQDQGVLDVPGLREQSTEPQDPVIEAPVDSEEADNVEPNEIGVDQKADVPEVEATSPEIDEEEPVRYIVLHPDYPLQEDATVATLNYPGGAVEIGKDSPVEVKQSVVSALGDNPAVVVVEEEQD